MGIFGKMFMGAFEWGVTKYAEHEWKKSENYDDECRKLDNNELIDRYNKIASVCLERVECGLNTYRDGGSAFTEINRITGIQAVLRERGLQYIIDDWNERLRAAGGSSI